MCSHLQNTDGKGILGTTVTVQESLPIIIGLVAGIFIIILLLIVCCLCCFRRHPLNVQSKKSHTNGFSNGDVPNHHNHVTSLVSEPSEQQKSLLAVVNPVQKPPRRYESSSPTGTEMTELKRNLLDETSISGQYSQIKCTQIVASSQFNYSSSAQLMADPALEQYHLFFWMNCTSKKNNVDFYFYLFLNLISNPVSVSLTFSSCIDIVMIPFK